MPFRGMSQSEMRRALSELDRALASHDHWCEDLNRTLICALPPDERDVSGDAHKHCRFGQWLYGAGCSLLSKNPSLKEIEDSHKRMHTLANEMLEAMAMRGKTPLELYERYVTSLNQMRLEILTAKRELEDAVYNLDPLSGAASRVSMLTRLREQHALVKRGLHSCAIAMMDFDHFKQINDELGHAAGDKAIMGVARLVMSKMRPYDMLFRYGGEEFLICEPDTDLETGYETIDRLRKAIAELSFEDGHGHSFQITASFGLVTLDAEATVEESIERADRAMYAAKRAGRNRVKVWDPSMAWAAA